MQTKLLNRKRWRTRIELALHKRNACRFSRSTASLGSVEQGVSDSSHDGCTGVCLTKRFISYGRIVASECFEARRITDSALRSTRFTGGRSHGPATIWRRAADSCPRAVPTLASITVPGMSTPTTTMIAPSDLTYIHAGDRTQGHALAFWLDVVSALAVRYEQGAYDSYSARTYWRGQARGWKVAPGLHRRTTDRHQGDLSDGSVVTFCQLLIDGARAIGLYPPSLPTLGDLQLLAYLQHQGAATPLVDFSTDLLTALAMLCFDEGSDSDDGVLLCYRYQPCNAAHVPPFTAATPETAFTANASSQIQLFHPPYATARQRIQRGVFFFSTIDRDNPNSTTGIRITDHTGSIAAYYAQHRCSGPSMTRPHPVAPNACAAIVVPHEHKPPLRDWLRSQHQLDSNYVYPESPALDMHREYIEANRASSPMGSNFGQKLF